MALRPIVGQGLLIIEASQSHSEHHTRQDFSGWVISLMQKPLSDNTQHPNETDVPGPGGIRTHNPNKWAAADPRLRPHGNWVLECNRIIKCNKYGSPTRSWITDIYFRAIPSSFHVTFLSLQVVYLFIIFPLVCKLYTASRVNFCQNIFLFFLKI